MRPVRLAAIAAALLVAIIASLYASLPLWLEPLARALVPAGYHIELRASRPTPWGMTFDRLVLADTGRGWRVTLAPLVVNWRLGTDRRVEIANAEVDLRHLRAAGGARGPAGPALDIGLPSLPFESLRITTLEILPPGSWLKAPARGRLESAGQSAHLHLTAPWRGAELALDAELHDSTVRATLRHAGRLAARLEATSRDGGAALPFDLQLRAGWLAHLLDTAFAGRARLRGTLHTTAGLQLDLDPTSALYLNWRHIDLSAALTGHWRVARGTLIAPSLPLTLAAGSRKIEARIGDLRVATGGAHARIDLERYHLPGRPALAERAAALRVRLDIEATRDALEISLDTDAGPAARARASAAGPNSFAIEAGLEAGWLADLVDARIDGQALLRGQLQLGASPLLDLDAASRMRVSIDDLSAAAGLGGRWTFADDTLRPPPLSFTVHSPGIGSLVLDAEEAAIAPRAASVRFVARGALPKAGRVSVRGVAGYDLRSGAVRLEAGASASAHPAIAGAPSDEITVRLLEPLIYSGATPISTRIELTTGPLRLPEPTSARPGRLVYTAKVEADPLALTTQFAGTATLGEVRARTAALIDPGSGLWRIDFRSTEGTSLTARPLPSLVHAIEPDLEVLEGSLTVHGTLDGRLGGDLPSLDAALEAHGIAFRYQSRPGAAERLATRLRGPLDRLIVGPTELAAGRWGTDPELADLHAHIGSFALSAPVARIDASLATLGGRATLACAAFDLAAVSGDCHVDLQGMELEQVVALEGQAAVKATGKVTGGLELGFDAGSPTFRGEVRADGGGRLIYRAEPALRQGADDAGLGLALAALEDFTYSDLRARLALDDSGRLTLNAELAGRNPEVENGREIRFNLNIDNQGFWQALQIALGITDNLERKLKEHR